MDKKRVEWIDACKGFAIVMVVIGHIADGYRNANSFPEYSVILRNIFNGIYMFHMALFFTLSGMTYQIAYVPKKNEGDAEQTRFKAQIINLSLLYIFYCLLNWVFKLALSSFVNYPVNISDILLIWGKPIYPYWFFYVMIALYLLFRVRVVCEGNQKMVLFVLTMISLISGYIETHEWFQIQHILFYAVFFYIGMLYIKNREFILFSKYVIILCTLISATTAALWWNKETIIYWTPIINMIVAFGLVLAFVYTFSKIAYFDRRKGLLNYLGKHSLEIYVIHCFLTGGNRVILPKIGVHGFWISFVINLIISISLPLIFSCITKGKTWIWNMLFAPQKLFTRKVMK